MAPAFYLLLVIGHLGAFDVLYFHTLRCRLAERPECQREVLWHTVRHLVYALQFLTVANLRLHGWALLGLGALYAADVFVAWADVWEEQDSRAPQGGLPRGEYFMHIVLSVLVGLYLMSVFGAVWPDRLLPTAVLVEPPVPGVLRALMNVMGVTALGAFARDFAGWLRRRRPSRVPSPGAARKVVVEVFIPAPVEEVWRRTQEPDAHVRWDLRFTTIRYLDATDARGFHLMDYRTRMGFGLEVKGFGRYLHSTPLEHSTFEFDSEDPLSLITRGRGVWMYEPRAGGTLFRTVFDYEVRHGALGLVVDGLLFRPLMQLATEWGFETLRRWCAGEVDAPEARGSRWRFLAFFLWRRLGGAPGPGEARSWLGSGRETAPGMHGKAVLT